MRKSTFVLGLILLSFVGLAKAEDAAAPTTMPTSAPATIAAGDKTALDAVTDQTATVIGTVSSAKWAASGKVMVIKFKDADDTQFSAAIFSKNKETMERALDGDIAKALVGAKITVHGDVKLFREHPEIVVDKADQIVIIEKAPTTAPADAG